MCATPIISMHHAGHFNVFPPCLSTHTHTKSDSVLTGSWGSGTLSLSGLLCFRGVRCHQTSSLCVEPVVTQSVWSPKTLGPEPQGSASLILQSPELISTLVDLMTFSDLKHSWLTNLNREPLFCSSPSPLSHRHLLQMSGAFRTA